MQIDHRHSSRSLRLGRIRQARRRAWPGVAQVPIRLRRGGSTACVGRWYWIRPGPCARAEPVTVNPETKPGKLAGDANDSRGGTLRFKTPPADANLKLRVGLEPLPAADRPVAEAHLQASSAWPKVPDCTRRLGCHGLAPRQAVLVVLLKRARAPSHGARHGRCGTLRTGSGRARCVWQAPSPTRRRAVSTSRREPRLESSRMGRRAARRGSYFEPLPTTATAARRQIGVARSLGLVMLPQSRLPRALGQDPVTVPIPLCGSDSSRSPPSPSATRIPSRCAHPLGRTSQDSRRFGADSRREASSGPRKQEGGTTEPRPRDGPSSGWAARGWRCGRAGPPCAATLSRPRAAVHCYQFELSAAAHVRSRHLLPP